MNDIISRKRLLSIMANQVSLFGMINAAKNVPDVFGDTLPTKEELQELADDLRRMAFSAEDSFVHDVSDKAATIIETMIL